jgi:ferrous iron transport protein A
MLAYTNINDLLIFLNYYINYLVEDVMMNHEEQNLLSNIRPGNMAIIASLQEGNEINRRLTSLGFTPGVHVEIVQNFGRGPMIVSVRGTRVALGRGEATRIFVRQAEK